MRIPTITVSGHAAAQKNNKQAKRAAENAGGFLGRVSDQLLSINPDSAINQQLNMVVEDRIAELEKGTPLDEVYDNLSYVSSKMDPALKPILTRAFREAVSPARGSFAMHMYGAVSNAFAKAVQGS